MIGKSKIANASKFAKQSTKTQHRIKLIAGFSLFTKVLADFKSVLYLLTLVPKTRN
jgi:hypothetical protein